MGSGNGPGDCNSDSAYDAKIMELEKQLRQSTQKIAELEGQVRQSKQETQQHDQEIKQLRRIEQEYNNIIGQSKHNYHTHIKNWWSKLYQALKINSTYDYDTQNLQEVRKYPEDIINLLREIQWEEEKQRDSLFNWSSKKDAEIAKLKELNLSLKAQLQKKEERIRDLEKIEADYSSIKKENDDLNSRYNRVLTEITALKTGGASAPQHEALYTAFKELKDQEFKELSNKIFKLRSQCNPDAKAERKLETAKIRSKLAEAVLMGVVEISKEGNITERDITKLSKSVLGKFVMYFASCGCRDIEKKFPAEAKEIEESIKRITKKALKLVNDIVHASPPGTLLWYEKEEGVEFNPEEHEVLLGCAEWGKIEFTVYPGYAVYEGDAKRRRIFEKATVFTALEKRT